MKKTHQLVDKVFSLGQTLNQTTGEAHPTEKMLEAYHHGLLSIEASDNLQDHLSLCDTCTQSLIQYASVAEEQGAPVPTLSKDEIHLEWQKLQQRQSVEENAALELVDETRAGLMRFRFPLLAAAFFLITFGGTIWILKLKKDLAALSQPRFSNTLVDLAPIGLDQVSRGDVDLQENFLEAGKDQVTLFFNRAEPFPSGQYRVSIFRDTDQPVWQSQVVSSPTNSKFNLSLPRGFLPKGRYRVQLETIWEERTDLVASYALTIRDP